MVDPVARPQTYQDVKASLRWYTSVFSGMETAVFVLAVLPASHRDALTSFVGESKLVGAGAVAVLIGFLSWMLVFFFEFHDRECPKFGVSGCWPEMLG